jgi:hypothetical protein
MKLLILLTLLSFNLYADYTKIGTNGLTFDIRSINWPCVLDNSHQLMWAVKTIDKALQDFSNTYTWYDQISGVINGGYSHNCSFYDNYNTWLYIELINEDKLCGYSDWRLPTYSESLFLLKFTSNESLIDINSFPNTRIDRYCSSALDKNDKDLILDVIFFYDGSSGSQKKFDSAISLVRDTSQLIK